MATKTIKRRVVPGGEVTSLLIRYLALGDTAKEVKRSRDQIRDGLLAFVEKNHEEDEEKGHLNYFFTEPLLYLGQTFLGFQKQRKVGQVFLEDNAEELCKAKEFGLDEYTSRYVDQDKIARLYAEDRLTEEEFNSLYEDNESWAFVPIKE